jgi:hypothetical protein
MNIEHKVKDREKGCPFGHTCDNCNLYIPLYRTDEKGKVTAVYDCQFNNMAMLSDELKSRMTGVQSAVENRMNALLTLASLSSNKAERLDRDEPRRINGD